MVHEQSATGKGVSENGGHAQEYLLYTVGPEEYAKLSLR